MNKKSTLIYELKNLKKVYNNNLILSIGRLQIHRGTIYGILGPILGHVIGPVASLIVSLPFLYKKISTSSN